MTDPIVPPMVIKMEGKLKKDSMLSEAAIEQNTHPKPIISPTHVDFAHRYDFFGFDTFTASFLSFVYSVFNSDTVRILRILRNPYTKLYRLVSADLYKNLTVCLKSRSRLNFRLRITAKASSRKISDLTRFFTCRASLFRSWSGRRREILKKAKSQPLKKSFTARRVRV